MASSNHVTPTNCSWWPISAMDEDGKLADGEESHDPPVEHKPFSKDRLVLYHWTQSFSSQKLLILLPSTALLDRGLCKAAGRTDEMVVTTSLK
ncbi:ganglioside-induced differentiation-associated protein 1-like 1 [Tachysurus ichikawai]